MKMNRIFAILLTLTVSTSAIADKHIIDKYSAEFFASNNASEIDLPTAFNRLEGDEQQNLQNDTIRVLQKNHIEQSKIENFLGTYRMFRDNHITADNSERIVTSSYQKLSAERVFKIGQELANILDQESVAVFIPVSKTGVGAIVLELKSHPYTINEIIKLIHEKLPPQYSRAFSLHLNTNLCSTFDNTIVDRVEWLGNNKLPGEIKKYFPQEQISSHYGHAYLVYKDGKRDQF